MGDQAAIDELTKVLEQVTLKTQKPKIPTFSDRHSRGKDTPFSDWYFIVQKAIKDNANLLSTEIVNMVFNSVSGEARSRYIMISENKTLTEILNAFRDAYEDNTNLIDRIQKLHNLKQDSHESVANFADKLKTTVHWIDQLDDKALYNKLDIMKSVFLNGLHITILLFNHFSFLW